MDGREWDTPLPHPLRDPFQPAIKEGQVLNDTYQLVRFIGEGGMGRVYEATHARLAGRYAIKVLLQKLSTDPEALQRFDREARITSSLQHPNIVQIVDFNTAVDGTEYLVMEYLRGESLAARLARLGPASLETTAEVVEQVAAGLAAAHSHGVVHRDLKPDNVFLVPLEGRDAEWAKILDFGISKVKDANHAPGAPVSSLVGTPLYMAPEQCEGRRQDVGPATDQFALAVIAYEMLTGRSPFAGNTLSEVLSRVLHAEPPPMGIDPGIEAVVRRGMAKSIRRRFRSVTAFAEALRAAVAAKARRVERRIEDSGVHAYAVGDTEGPDPEAPARQRHWGTVLVVAAAVTVCTALIVRTARTGASQADQSQRRAPEAESLPHSAPLVAPATRPIPLPAASLPQQAETPSSDTAVSSGSPSLEPPLDTAPDPSPAGTGTVIPLRPLETKRSAAPARERTNAPAKPAASPRARPERAIVTQPPPPKLTDMQPAVGGQPLPRAPQVQPPPLQPRPLRPLIMDEDATLPLDEKLSER